MPIPSTVADLSLTASANYPGGGESPSVIDDYLRAYASIIKQVSDAKQDAATAITATSTNTLSNKTLDASCSLAGNAATSTTAAACSGNSATATTVADGGVSTTAKLANNIVTNAKLARAGTSGQVLTSQGTGADPAWAAIPPQNGVNAWVNFNGTSSGTITPRANSNIASVTKNGTGDYTLNIAGGAVADANYCSVGSASADASSNLRSIVVTFEQTASNTFQARTTTSIRLTTRYGAGNDAWDPTTVCVALFR